MEAAAQKVLIRIVWNGPKADRILHRWDHKTVNPIQKIKRTNPVVKVVGPFPEGLQRLALLENILKRHPPAHRHQGSIAHRWVVRKYDPDQTTGFFQCCIRVHICQRIAFLSPARS
ncbi:MAG: hypothetical protein BWY82_02764 [Verrucomicrobia bacterium ADurb.Bin474]|nr:MAG: hypothetical protein BWY82_02764 [Verrucomicrobia bacterium ADurb.Bin474]